MNRTFIICKPDAVERGLVGQILSRFETKGFSIVAAELRTLDADTLARHYEEHVGKGFYDDLVAFMSRVRPRCRYRGPGGNLGDRSRDDGRHQPDDVRSRHDSRRFRHRAHRKSDPRFRLRESAAREIGIFFPELG